ncbi:hypothetical protein EBR43_09965 [bacterium]|nr:hypothetical protein [bacterium]
MNKKIKKTKSVSKPGGQLLKTEPNGDKLYLGNYSYSVYNKDGEKIKFDIDWTLLSSYLKQI